MPLLRYDASIGESVLGSIPPAQLPRLASAEELTATFAAALRRTSATNRSHLGGGGGAAANLKVKREGLDSVEAHVGATERQWKAVEALLLDRRSQEKA